MLRGYALQQLLSLKGEAAPFHRFTILGVHRCQRPSVSKNQDGLIFQTKSRGLILIPHPL
jgi:hypothetical protein